MTFSGLEQFNKIFLVVTLLVIGGLPPFSGFLIKINVLFSLGEFITYILIRVLIISSIFIIYMYTTIFFRSITIGNKQNKFIFRRGVYVYTRIWGVLVLTGIVCIFLV